jgi:hypothetical protein
MVLQSMQIGADHRNDIQEIPKGDDNRRRQPGVGIVRKIQDRIGIEEPLRSQSNDIEPDKKMERVGSMGIHMVETFSV